MQLHHYYIYYPVRMGSEADLARCLYNTQADLANETGVLGRFLCRADDPWTWMEIYENVRDVERFEASLARLVTQHGLERFIEHGGRRHLERFIPCA
ncbi:DUF4936 family protein [Zoogloea sp.]|uniref:DUF4936 family protein n=1 Tax=Zoogloea sp. TaxID=49181 RepID=UPI00260955FA|nr:DUF4936 family protein [Zoogloea sp.]MDD3353983.1 DUF4936 family protein [Zoogloea sp.]